MGAWSLVAVLAVLPVVPAQSGAQAREVLTDIRVHGNQIVTAEEVIALAGVQIGQPFEDRIVADVTARLRASGRFETIDVRKRYASIEDPTRIALVIFANEGPVRIVMPDLPGVEGAAAGRPEIRTSATWRHLMFAPMTGGPDSPGVTYGVRVAYAKPIGGGSRLSFPLTWGGTRQAGVALDKTLSRGPITRFEIGASVDRRENPAYEIGDLRRRAWGRIERAAGPVRLGATGGWQRVTFGPLEDDLRTIGVDAAFDTRIDPVLPRNAVFVATGVERVFFASGGDVTRTRVDARGYVGVVGQQVLAVRALRESADRALPPYLQYLLGGQPNLRGFERGHAAGDTLVAASLEYRIPITSPMSVGKLGVSVFADWGTAYAHGQRLRDQRLERGAGAGVWFTVTAVRVSLAVAHGRGAGTRAYFGGALTF